jgi:hypothetical protein
LDFKDHKGSHKEQRVFIAVIYDDYNNNDLKKFIKTGYFIVDQTLKIINLTSFAFDLLMKLNRRFNSDSFNYLLDVFPELIVNKKSLHREYTLGRGSHVQESPQPVLFKKGNTMFSINENEDEHNESMQRYNSLKNSLKESNVGQNHLPVHGHGKMSMNLKSTILNLDGDSIEVELMRRKESEIDIEPDSYFTNFSLLSLEFSENDDSTMKGNSTELIQNENEEHQDEEVESEFYAVKVKSFLRDNMKFQNSKVPIRNKCLYPKIQSIYSSLKGGNLKFYDMIKQEKGGLLSYYTITESGDKIEDYYKDLNTGFDGSNEGNSNSQIEESERDSAQVGETSENESDESEEENDSIASLNMGKEFMSNFIIKSQAQFEKHTSDEFRKVMEKLVNYARGINYRIIKPEGTVDEVTNFYPQVYEFIKHKQSVLVSSDDINLMPTKKEAYLNQSKTSSSGNKSKTPMSLQKLSYSSIAVTFIFIAYAIFEYIYNNNALNSYENNFNLIKISFNALEQFQICAFLIRNLILVNKDHNETIEGWSRDDYIADKFLNLITFQNSLSQINQDLVLNSVGLISRNDSILSKNDVPILLKAPFGKDTLQEFTFLHAFKEVNFFFNSHSKYLFCFISSQKEFKE